MQEQMVMQQMAAAAQQQGGGPSAVLNGVNGGIGGIRARKATLRRR